MKIRPVGAELFLADRQTDRHDEANSHHHHHQYHYHHHRHHHHHLANLQFCHLLTRSVLTRLEGSPLNGLPCFLAGWYVAFVFSVIHYGAFCLHFANQFPHYSCIVFRTTVIQGYSK